MPRNEATDVFLVGGIPTPLKNFSQMGLLFPIRGKIKKMFQTTNQFFLGSGWIWSSKCPTKMILSGKHCDFVTLKRRNNHPKIENLPNKTINMPNKMMTLSSEMSV